MTDANTTASTSDTGSDWGSGGSDDGQEPDVERTTALITGEFLFFLQTKADLTDIVSQVLLVLARLPQCLRWRRNLASMFWR